jgi:hypothetical protein
MLGSGREKRTEVSGGLVGEGTGGEQVGALEELLCLVGRRKNFLLPLTTD